MRLSSLVSEPCLVDVEVAVVAFPLACRAWPLVAIGGGHPSKLRACKIIEGSSHVPFSPGNNFKPDFYGDLDPLGC